MSKLEEAVRNVELWMDPMNKWGADECKAEVMEILKAARAFNFIEQNLPDIALKTIHEKCSGIGASEVIGAVFGAFQQYNAQGGGDGI